MTPSVIPTTLSGLFLRERLLAFEASTGRTPGNGALCLLAATVLFGGFVPRFAGGMAIVASGTRDGAGFPARPERAAWPRAEEEDGAVPLP